MQGFDAPWPVIQANAVYLCSSTIAISDYQHMSAVYCNQVIIHQKRTFLFQINLHKTKSSYNNCGNVGVRNVGW